MEDLEHIYNKMTLKELTELTDNQIDCVEYTNRIYSLIGSKQRFADNDTCIVTDVQYFRQLPTVLSNASDTLIANYLGFIMVKDFGEFTVEAFRKLDFELASNLLGVEKQTELWKVCLNLVRNTMSFAVSRKYVKDTFPDKNKAMVIDGIYY